MIRDVSLSYQANGPWPNKLTSDDRSVSDVPGPNAANRVLCYAPLPNIPNRKWIVMSRGYRITYIFMRLVSKREVKGKSRYKTTSDEGRLTGLGFEAVRWNLTKYSGFQLKRIVWKKRDSDRKNEFVSKQLN